MALAVVLMLALVPSLTLSGYATYNDWGDALGGDWLEELHELFGNAFLIVVLAHLALITLGLERAAAAPEPGAAHAHRPPAWQRAQPGAAQPVLGWRACCCWRCWPLAPGSGRTRRRGLVPGLGTGSTLVQGSGDDD